MPRDAFGTMTKPANTTAVQGQVASPTSFNTLMDDIVSEITASVPIAGTKAMTGALAMGSHKITGLADGVDSTDAATVGQVASGYQATSVIGADIAGLTDPGTDSIGFWDDSAGHFTWLTPGTNLSISGTVLNASGGAGSADWGSIGGTLSNQTDLVSALAGKQNLDTDLTTLSTAFTSASASGPASLQLHEDTDNGTNKITLIAPSSIASDKTVTFQDITGTVIVTGGSDLPIADGGTAASTASAAFDNLKQNATTAATGVCEMATAAEFRANTATANLALSPAEVWSAAAEVTWTDASSIAVDWSAGINFTVTLGGARTLANGSNEKAGQSGFIRIKQDGTGSRTLAYGTDYEFAGGSAPTLSTAAAAEDVLTYYIVSSTRVLLAVYGKAFA